MMHQALSGMWRIVARLRIFLLRREFISNILGWYGVYEFSMRGPSNVSRVAYMYLLTHRNRHLRRRLVAELLAQPECEKIIRERQRLIILDEFSGYAEGTLGWKYYQHMRDNNLTLPVPLDAAIKSDFQYIIHRLLVTHDLYHTILNIPVDSYGEMIVAAFTSAQIPSYAPPAVHVAAGGLHVAIKEHALIDRLGLASTIGFLLGKSSKQLFSVDWNRLWKTPIDEVQTMLSIDLKKIESAIDGLRNADFASTHAKPNYPTTIYERRNNRTLISTGYKIKGARSDIHAQAYTPVKQPIRANVIFGRAMFCSGRYFAAVRSPSMTSCFLEHGMQVFVPDFRENDQSRCNFDDMVDDAQACVTFVKALQPNVPVFLVGHSLGGLCFLASQGLAAQAGEADGVVTIGTATWHKEYVRAERYPFRLKLRFFSELVRILPFFFGYAPAKLFKFGDVDEHTEMIKQVTLTNIDQGKWQSIDGQRDYYDMMKKVRCPVLSLASRQDELMPASLVKRFHQNLALEPDYLLVDDYKHMELCGSGRAWPIWEDIAAWIKEAADRKRERDLEWSRVVDAIADTSRAVA